MISPLNKRFPRTKLSRLNTPAYYIQLFIGKKIVHSDAPHWWGFLIVGVINISACCGVIPHISQ